MQLLGVPEPQRYVSLGNSKYSGQVGYLRWGASVHSLGTIQVGQLQAPSGGEGVAGSQLPCRGVHL